jgi:hypothetical protein
MMSFALGGISLSGMADDVRNRYWQIFMGIPAYSVLSAEFQPAVYQLQYRPCLAADENNK